MMIESHDGLSVEASVCPSVQRPLIDQVPWPPDLGTRSARLVLRFCSSNGLGRSLGGIDQIETGSLRISDIRS